MDRLDCDRMFVAVLEVGSFAGAAERLGTSSGQASKLVSRLEQELGVQLFKRSTRALSPTEVGRAYYERVKTLLEAFDTLDATVREKRHHPHRSPENQRARHFRHGGARQRVSRFRSPLSVD